MPKRLIKSRLNRNLSGSNFEGVFISPFMNFKFRLETDNPIIKDWAELKVISNGEIIKIGDDTVIFFESDGETV